MTRLVSFCIPAHNEELLLPATISAIHAAAKELALDYEIVVADDASTDATATLARDAGARVIPIDRRQIAAARNAAARATTGDILFFIDADTLVHANAVRQALDLLNGGCVAGGALISFDGAVPRWAIILLGALIALYRTVRLSAGAFMFCTREAYEKSGGYDESLFGGEEVYFAMALKRVGRFRLIKDRVVTSGRKLRAYSCGEVVRTLTSVSLHGKKGVGNRDRLEMWYGPRRADPGEISKAAKQQTSK